MKNFGKLAVHTYMYLRDRGELPKGKTKQEVIDQIKQDLIDEYRHKAG